MKRKSQISDQGQINGRFTKQIGRGSRALLKAVALPAPVTEESVDK
jgi:preprotein translocase subunit SecD